MPAPVPRALSIALPLWQALPARPFSGAVDGAFARACNLSDDRGRVVALTMPEVGNGPFSIVVEAAAGWFLELAPGQRATVDAERVVVGAREIPLAGACTWDARLPAPGRLLLSPAITATLQPYSRWPARAAGTPIAAAMAQLLARGARALAAALERGSGVAAAARQLAGLGLGLTPAGDDYLVGVIAALWLLGEIETASIIARSAAPHTTTLSAAFLRAAASGQFAEPWHQLARALAGQHALECIAVARRIAAIGASSGRDALAGFTRTAFALRSVG
jgi:hypothetical protein